LLNYKKLKTENYNKGGTMNKKIISIAMVVAMLAVAILPVTVMADTTGSVSCTVTAQLISVTVSDGNVSFGVVSTSGTKNTIGTETQTATNNGTVAEKFRIKSSNAVGGTGWTLGASAGANVFTLAASINGSSFPLIMTTADTYIDLVTSVAVSGHQDFDLQIGMPTSSDTTEKTITLTVLAEAAS
jgi:hypothetical protein